MVHYEKIVPDTSIIIEGIIAKGKEITADEIIVHVATLQELEHQANEGKAKGFLGLEELKRIKEYTTKNNISLQYKGIKVTGAEIRFAKQGEIDAKIRELAYDEDATLITADKIQYKVAEARGVKAYFYKAPERERKLKLNEFFDETTMSVHIKEDTIPYAKKGTPGNWNVVYVRDKKITQDEIQEISREIIEEAGLRKDSFIEVEREGSTIIQLGRFRTVITKPPFSDGWEITAVRPVKKLSLEEYKLSEKLYKRVVEQAEGVLVAGAPGMGKTTFASALAEFYESHKKTVKTIEAPRDLVLPDTITQYAISHGDAEEIHDILLLTRPDYTLFDEMRNTKDFQLYADLRLAGIGLVGVIHATNAIDAIQRFVGRIELGVIPHVIDTVIFIKNGIVDKVLALEMLVKVPAGMTEEDLARPVVVVTDFETNVPYFELYSYGEQTVVIPVRPMEKTRPMQQLAAKQIEQELQQEIGNIKVRVIGENRAELYVPQQKIANVIGRQGKNIEELEKKLGIHLDVKELTEEQEKTTKQAIKYTVQESKKAVVLQVPPKYGGKSIDVYVDNHFLFSSTLGKKAEVKINKKSKLGQTLLEDIDQGKRIELRV